ncbi:MAG: hypothetical protein M9944_12825 [Rhizobiaceae bacterium]|nr:hypothetical protein [Rhizobiaceae bacterium]
MKHEQNLEGEPIDISAELNEAARDEDVHRMEDINQKIAAKYDGMAIETARQTKAECAAIDAEIKALQQRKATVRETGKANVTRYKGIAKCARAYVAMSQEVFG